MKFAFNIMELKNWYGRSLLKIAQQGEWWIQDGYAQYADGDIGDMNHEAVVIESAQSDLAGGSEEYYDWKISTAQEILDEEKAELEQKKLYLDESSQEHKEVEDLLYDIWEKSQDLDYHAHEIIWENAESQGIDKELFDIAEGHGDARDYGMKKYRWKRVQGSNIQTWTLTQDDLNSIARGLDDILEHSGVEEDEDPKFTIEVSSTGQLYTASASDIQSKNLQAVTGESKGNEEGYNAAFEQQDRPSISFYQRWGD